MMNEQDIVRYSRQVLLPDFGGVGQQRLFESHIAMELSEKTPSNWAALPYLVAAGIGKLSLIAKVDVKIQSVALQSCPILVASNKGEPIAVLIDLLAGLNPGCIVEFVSSKAALLGRAGEAGGAKTATFFSAESAQCVGPAEILSRGGQEAFRLLHTIASK